MRMDGDDMPTKNENASLIGELHDGEEQVIFPWVRDLFTRSAARIKELEANQCDHPPAEDLKAALKEAGLRSPWKEAATVLIEAIEAHRCPQPASARLVEAGRYAFNAEGTTDAANGMAALRTALASNATDHAKEQAEKAARDAFIDGTSDAVQEILNNLTDRNLAMFYDETRHALNALRESSSHNKY